MIIIEFSQFWIFFQINMLIHFYYYLIILFEYMYFCLSSVYFLLAFSFPQLTDIWLDLKVNYLFILLFKMVIASLMLLMDGVINYFFSPFSKTIAELTDYRVF